MSGWRLADACSLGDCVEVRGFGPWVWMRDSKDPGGPVLEFSADEFAAFVAGVKAGEFDSARQMAKDGARCPTRSPHP